MKKHRYQFIALLLSMLMVEGSLTGSIFAVQTFGETADLPVLEVIKESNKSELANAWTGQDSEIESTQEIEVLKVGASKAIQNSDKSKENINQTVSQEEYFTEGKTFELSNSEYGQNETVPEETVEIYVGGRLSGVSYEHEVTEAVSFEIDESLPIETYCFRDDVYGYTTNLASCLFLPSGKGSGLIKVIDDQSKNVLKIFKININIYEEEVTLCNGSYMWTSICGTPSSNISWDNSDGVEITFRGTNNYEEPDDILGTYYIYDCNLVVKGKQIGDYPITFYLGENEYHKITYHVVEHDYQESNILKKATCTEDGMVEKECAVCHDKITVTIPATGHTWNEEYTVDRESSCTEEGSESIHCSVCEAIDENTVRIVPKKDHRYSDWTITKEVTCTEEGSKEKVCADCEDKVTEIIPTTGHTWNEEYTVDKESSCTEEGSESIHCSVCNAIDESTVRTIPRKAHAYGDWAVTKEANCTEEGSREKVCADCGDIITEGIPATGHTWNEEFTVDREASCTEEGSESIHCSVCEALDDNTVRTIPKKNHSYGDWTITKDATCAEAGSKEKICADCGEKIAEEIPAPGHIWNEKYTVDKEATYTEEGSESIHCSICNEIKEGTSRAIPKLPKPISMLTVLGIVNKTYTGDAVTQEIVIQDGLIKLNYDTDYTVMYNNNTNAGTATVAITGIGDYEGTVEKTFTIDQAPIISAVVMGVTNSTYNGSAQIQNPTVRVGNRRLTEDTDYTLSYANNTNAGTATVMVTGKGNYTGTISADFIISPLSFSKATVTGISSKTYAGSAQTQNPVVNIGNKTLIKDTDYKLSYSNNTNAGIGTVTVTGIGNYEGSITSQFKINKATQSITAKAAVSCIAVGKTTTVSITGNKGAKSFKSSDTTIATVDKSTGKVTAKKVGTVKITATSAVTANYNAASKTVTIKVVPAGTASLKADNQATGIKLTWKKVTWANGYKIYRGSTLIKTITSGNTVTFADTKANTNGTKYVYKVVAKAATGDSTLSKSVAVYRVARPTVSSVTNSAASKMTVKWGKNAKATGYQIQYSTDKTFKSGTKAVTVAGASAVSKVIGSLTKSKTYYVRIRTYKTVGTPKYWSVWSAAKSVKIAK